ncbi:uncharacterized protein ARMOST_18191 [Armillaria ostoyae]|uniref:Uncharacterized protein n=1 Tax=Armillaria ostoyae TaxID=47428 RepID=A0A284S154_ARMOS|nr:uncharacterized protein ARMOST_18191 [Armillaria ostoyae]
MAGFAARNRKGVSNYVSDKLYSQPTSTMSVLQHPRYAAEIPLMSSCSEIKERLVIEGVGFSPFQKWYLDAASVNTHNRVEERQTISPREPLFFAPLIRAVSGLLPMALANFRVQMYATKDLWDSFERTEEKEK